MALHITEYADMGYGHFRQIISAPLEPPLADQTVSIGAGSLQSNTLNASTRICRLHTTANCHIQVGTSPTASSSTRRMVADSTEFICVPENSALKIAVIQQ